MESKQKFILSKDGQIYDFTVLIFQENNEEILNLELKKENSFDSTFKFSGSITHLIDQVATWKKFEMEEIVEIIIDLADKNKLRWKLIKIQLL